MQFTLLSAGQKATLAAVVAAGFALVPTAHAQTAGAPPPMAAAAPLPDASKDDPAKVAAARDFLMAYRPRLNAANVTAMMDKGKKQFAQALKNGDPKLTDAQIEVIMAKRRVQVLARTNDQLDKQAHLISRYFTLQELKDLTAFFSHGAGQKLIDVTPKIQMEMMRQQAVARALPAGTPGAMQSKSPDASKAPAKASPPPKK